MKAEGTPTIDACWLAMVVAKVLKVPKTAGRGAGMEPGTSEDGSPSKAAIRSTGGRDERDEVGVVPGRSVRGNRIARAMDRNEEAHELDEVDFVEGTAEDSLGHLLGHRGVELDLFVRGGLERPADRPVRDESIRHKLVTGPGAGVEKVDRPLQWLGEGEQPLQLVRHGSPESQLTRTQHGR